jgi:hypothetical protein
LAAAALHALDRVKELLAPRGAALQFICPADNRAVRRDVRILDLDGRSAVHGGLPTALRHPEGAIQLSSFLRQRFFPVRFARA